MLVALSLLLNASLMQSSTRTVRYFEMEPTPYGEILLSKPVLEWKVWGDGVRIGDVQTTVDGNTVPSDYETEKSAVVAPLEKPLSAGSHSVNIRISFATGQVVEKNWKFQVAENAIRTFPRLLQNQSKLVQEVDRLRAQHSLPPVKPNGPLCASAQSHADYMAANGRSGHRQESSDNGFTGRTPGERARAFGYFDRNGEAVAVSSRFSIESVENLFDAPYHRIMFLQPGSPDFGAGSSGNATCIKFGGKHEDAIVVSPAKNMTGVKRTWDGIETPDPMAGDGSGAPYGYPIVLAVFGKYAEGFAFKSAVLKDEKGKVFATRVLHPENDEHAHGCVIMVPNNPLKAKHSYSVAVEFRASGRTHKNSWRFKTD